MSANLRALAANRIAHIAAASLFTAAIVALAWGHVSWSSFVSSLSSIAPVPAVAALAAYVAVTALRAWRFILAGARLRFSVAFGIAAAHAALLRVMPLKSGELAYGILLKKFKGGGFTEGLATILMLRILDFAILLSATGCLALAIPGPGTGMKAAALALTAIALAAIFFGLKPSALALESFSRSRFAPDGKIAKLTEALVKAYALPISKRLALIGVTVCIWSMILLWLYLCALSVFPLLGFGEGLFTAALGAVGSILPVSLIGSLGPYEAGLAVGLTNAGASHDTAASASLAVSALTFSNNTVVAVLFWAVAALWRLSKKTRENRTDAPGNPAKKGRAALATALFSIAGGMLLLVRIRYGFEINDQLQYLLLPYRNIYRDFLPGDWFTWKTTHYHVFFSLLIQALHLLLGDKGLPWGVLAMHILVLIGVAYGIVAISNAAGWGWTSAAYCLVAVAFVRSAGVAGALVNHGLLLPADMALPAFLIGSAAWLKGNGLRSGLWLGLSGLIHPNFAVLGPFVIFPIEIWRAARRRDWIRPTMTVLGYLFLAWPSLFHIASGFLLSDSVPQALDIFFEFRSPHHYKPVLLASAGTWWIVALLAAGLPLWLSRVQTEQERKTRSLLLALLIVQAAAAAASIFEIRPIVRLYLWRMSVPLFILGALAAGENLSRAFRSGRRALLIFSCCSLLMIAAFPSISGRSSEKIDKPSLRTALNRLSSFQPVRAFPGGARGRNGKFYEWIRKNTPNDAAFLVPPGLSEFRMMARRSIFVDWKCCPMKGSEVLEWKRRMLAEMGTADFPAAGYALENISNKLYFSRSLRDLAELAKQERLSHIVALERGKTEAEAAGLRKLATFGALSVYEAVPFHRIGPK